MLKIYFDDVLINEDAYAELTNEYKLFEDSFYLGSTASNTFELKVLKSEVVSHPNNVTIEDDNTTFHLIVDKVEEDKGFYNYTLVDKMVNFNFNYDAKPLIDEKAVLEEETYLSDILADMCLKADVELDYTLTNNIIVNWYDNRIQAREYLSFIAELEGGYACINELGKLTIKQHKQSSKKTISADEVSELIIGEKKNITRVVFDNGLVKWEFGDDVGNTLYLNPNNVFITDENVVENIYDKIVGFEFYSITVPNTLIDSSIKAGDVITFVDDTNEYPTIAQYSSSYGGGWVGSYDFNINTTKQEETKILGIEENILSIKTEIDRTNAELKITAEKITDLTDFTKNITNQGDLIELPNTPKSNGAIRELTIKNFQLLELYPGMTYPSGFVYPGVLNFYTLIFDNVDTFDNNPHYVNVQSPVPLQSIIVDGTTYHNELVIEDNEITVIERIKWNFETDEFEVVPIPTVHSLGNAILPTFEEDTYIKVDYFTDLIFDAEYLIKNEFTDTFATQTESSSQFTINSEEIATKVSKDNIISEINQSAEEIKISANKITLQGNEEFTSIISQINNEINQVKDQIDGKVSTWYGEDVPTLYNYPADGWITEEERNNHLGDLYYDDNGQAYRFSFQDNEYFWKPIADSDIQAIYEELNSKITQTASEINLEVAKKTNKTEIISTINQSAEAVTINANKISLAGKTIDLTSDNIVIDSTNFKVTKAGVVTATSADISGKITATSGSIGGWRITDTLLGTHGAVADTVFMSRTGQNAYINGFGISPSCCFYSKGNFAVTTDGKLYANNADIQGKITATSGNIGGFTLSSSGFTGSTATGSMRILRGSSAAIDFPANGGRLMLASGTGVPNVALTSSGGSGANGLCISDVYSWTGTGAAGYSIGIRTLYGGIRIACGDGGSIIRLERTTTSYIELGNNVNIQGGYTQIQSYRLAGHTFTGAGGAQHYSNANCMFKPASGYYAYINSVTTANKIAVSSAGPSSRNIKKNIEPLKYDNIYKDLQKLNTYTFDYKYDGIKDNKTDFGFIIDEIEELPTISKFVKHYDVDGYIQDGKLIPKRDNDEEQKNMTPFNYKEWDRDSYIKMSLVLIKSLQEKVDNLERMLINGQTD